ncbi:hypothetical protein [Pseudotenacibaculum haliotis]|uniref:Uncharacterized protein n=1 Tax=Pseudotenacibaculum haliotis TaxID=1862138 RepID=A0ABW5LQR6_9FLAO
MSKTISNFVIRILFFTGVTFGLHLLVLKLMELPLFADKIVLAYIVNVALAIIVFVFLFVFRQRFKNQLGFIFISGSMIKFALFFTLFYGAYKKDGSISETEFFAFFIPYLLTLVIEIFSLSKWLNKLDELPS